MSSTLHILVGDIARCLPEGWALPKDGRMTLYARYYAAPVCADLTNRAEAELADFLQTVPLTTSRKADVGIAFTDLVENAIAHGDQASNRCVETVFLYVPDYVLLIGVADNLPLVPASALLADPTTPDALAALSEHGRGLFIVRALFEIFSQVQALDGKGKILWFGINMKKEACND